MGAWLFMAGLTSPVWVQLGIDACRVVRGRAADGVWRSRCEEAEQKIAGDSPDPDLSADGEV